MSEVILASSSEARRRLLDTIISNFKVVPPKVKEVTRKGETVKETVMRLAFEKAREVSDKLNTRKAIIISSDQIACCKGKTLFKPLNREKAVEILRFLRGERVKFYTSVCVMDSGNRNIKVKIAEVKMRKYDDREIYNYLESDNAALNCCAAFRIEGSGIRLVKKVKSNDPSVIMGLPLITLCKILRLKKIL